MKVAILIRAVRNDQFVACYPYSTIPLKEKSTVHKDFDLCWQKALRNNFVKAGTEELYYFSFVDLEGRNRKNCFRIEKPFKLTLVANLERRLRGFARGKM
ncbi:hypothetical protein SAMN06296273_0528 [Nitrosomonas ureae]|uniref:Uncharacterized protein n=1 Tax=Nitrosomonas ureae TaxID=44577 RepID=A0A285BW01_9PROT|nr:hypothetical protein [Nitrosomonas ureae]SNX59086.1 hypothetical protein SAMN06296273_0528 [Nitrosomonas ureae]